MTRTSRTWIVVVAAWIAALLLAVPAASAEAGSVLWQRDSAVGEPWQPRWSRARTFSTVQACEAEAPKVAAWLAEQWAITPRGFDDPATTEHIRYSPGHSHFTAVLRFDSGARTLTRVDLECWPDTVDPRK